MPFIKPQQDRTDIHWKELVMIEEDGELVILGEVPVNERDMEDSAHGGNVLSQSRQVCLWPCGTTHVILLLTDASAASW